MRKKTGFAKIIRNIFWNIVKVLKFFRIVISRLYFNLISSLSTLLQTEKNLLITNTKMPKKYTNKREVVNAIQSKLNTAAAGANGIDWMALLHYENPELYSLVDGAGGKNDAAMSVAALIANLQPAVRKSFASESTIIGRFSFSHGEEGEIQEAWTIVNLPFPNYRLIFAGNLVDAGGNPTPELYFTHVSSARAYEEYLLKEQLISQYIGFV